jgi:hypothetical protein
MPWARIDDQANDDDKLNALGSDAFRLWVRGLVYCQKKLTDGFIPDIAIAQLAVFARERDRPGLIEELCASLVVRKGPLWHREPGGYRMHDYHDYNDRADTVRRERELSKERMQRFRKRVTNGATATVTNGVTNGVTNAERTASVQPSISMYHGTEKQERAPSAPLHPVEAVENRIVRFQRRRRSRETSSGKPAHRVITALVRSLLKTNPSLREETDDESTVLEFVKVHCAQKNLLYDSASAALALDVARAQLRKRKDVPA